MSDELKQMMTQMMAQMQQQQFMINKLTNELAQEKQKNQNNATQQFFINSNYNNQSPQF